MTACDQIQRVCAGEEKKKHWRREFLGFYKSGQCIDPSDIDATISCNKASPGQTLSRDYIHYLRSRCVTHKHAHTLLCAPTFSAEHVFTSSYATNTRPSTCINVTDVAAGVAMWGTGKAKRRLLGNSRVSASCTRIDFSNDSSLIHRYL